MDIRVIPNLSCPPSHIICVFFCGGAGPETVMEIYAKTPIKFTSEAVTIRGKLELNSDDVNRLIYSLTNAEPVEEK